MMVSGSGRLLRSEGVSFAGASDCVRLLLCFLFLLEGEAEGWGSEAHGLPLAAKILSISDICDFGGRRTCLQGCHVTTRAKATRICCPFRALFLSFVSDYRYSPQNGHQSRQQPGLPNFPANQQFDSNSQAGFFNMDPAQAARQMAALNASGHARLANSRTASASTSGAGTAPYLGNMSATTYSSGNPDLLNSLNTPANFQIPNNQTIGSAVNTSFLDPTMAQPGAARNPTQAALQLRQRQVAFLNGLANIMSKRNTPLPPALTGVPTPDYDHTNSPWKLIEPSSEVGSFRLAGKDVNLFKLWGLVQHNGGGHAVCPTRSKPSYFKLIC